MHLNHRRSGTRFISNLLGHLAASSGLKLARCIAGISHLLESASHLLQTAQIFIKSAKYALKCPKKAEKGPFLMVFGLFLGFS